MMRALRKIYGLGLIAAWLLVSMAQPVAGKYYRTAQTFPDVLIYTDSADGTNGECPLAVIVDKSRQQVSLYQYDKRWRAMGRWACSTGKIQGRKTTEGDQKTPEGVYFVIRDVGARYLTETYGSRALPLDYPNWMDRRQHRTGSAIWFHGTNKPLKAHESNGCVVMENSAISDLAGFVRLRQTPVIIVDRLDYTSQKALRPVSRTILAAMEQWRRILNHGSYDAFKQCYTPEARPSMTWWRQWCGQRNTHTLGAGHRSILRHLTVLKDGKHYVVLFDHYLATDVHRVLAGRCKLYLAVEDNRASIIGGAYQEGALHGKDPLFHAWEKLWTIERRGSNLAAGTKPSSGT